MEENKDLIIEAEQQKQPVEDTLEQILLPEDEAPQNSAKKNRNIRLLKKGSYSFAITAVVLAVIVAFNIFISVLSDKVELEFDMSSNKVSSLTEENKDYLKGIKQEVSVVFCADSQNYANGIMNTYAEKSNIYGGSDYYAQTIKLVEKYAELNKNIKLQFIDTQDSAFAGVTSAYPDESISYGDIIVSSGEGEALRYKHIAFNDIYSVEYNEQYAQYGYTMYNVTGSNLESELSGAIEYAITGETLNFGIITGHSKSNYTKAFAQLLTQNNYSAAEIDSALITNIDKAYDVLIIAAPSVDFTPEEILVLSSFLENGGKYGKGILYFADATVPMLPNLSAFLKEWGIKVNEGILFETDSNNYMPEMPTAMGLYPETDDVITENMNIFCTGCNVPLEVIDAKNTEVTSLITTNDTVVNAPIGTSDGWKDASKYPTATYSGLIQAKRTDEKGEKSSYVFAFSSAEFIDSQWAEYSSFSNLNIALAAAERAGGLEESGVSFVTKTITNESFADKVNEGSVGVIRLIFVFLLPLITVAIGVYIYIKRRNA